jgi:hypothetical protein
MKSETHIFVSYTRRDGEVTLEMLSVLRGKLQSLCTPFIHAVEKEQKHTQLNVIKRLLTSHLLILIVSPSVYKSPWVRFELLLAKLKLMPVIKLSASDISKLLISV